MNVEPSPCNGRVGEESRFFGGDDKRPLSYCKWLSLNNLKLKCGSEQQNSTSPGCNHGRSKSKGGIEHDSTETSWKWWTRQFKPEKSSNGVALMWFHTNRLTGRLKLRFRLVIIGPSSVFKCFLWYSLKQMEVMENCPLSSSTATVPTSHRPVPKHSRGLYDQSPLILNCGRSTIKVPLESGTPPKFNQLFHDSAAWKCNWNDI